MQVETFSPNPVYRDSRTCRRFRRRAFALAGRRPWFAFFSFRVVFAIALP